MPGIDEQSLKKEIGLRFKEFRTAIGKKQAELAAELNLNQTTIGNIEKGKSFPGIAYLQFLSGKYRLDINWLFNKNVEMFLKFKELKPPFVSWIPTHISESDPRYEQYVEMMNLMRVTEIEVIIFGKLLETKLFAKEEIENYFKE